MFCILSTVSSSSLPVTPPLLPVPYDLARHVHVLIVPQKYVPIKRYWIQDESY